ncbi:metal-dependent hydrolase [Natronorubrum sulfidifaciens]|uniref:metal-dependent hydrolase n=1 Tax=Natronorubrum sulfidifaciens TaxID=388259 RepID=UPI000677A92E|nr:metal-dependent hydrolase [Natronorubrum sulfidifaciens]
MADVLTHVLVGYIIGTLLSIRYERVQPTHVTLVMIGALSPDFVKIELLVPDGLVMALLGVPFSWSPLHTLGGTVLVICLGSLLLAPEYRAQALALFAIGALSHHTLDVLLMTPTGDAYAVFWPLTEYRLPAGGLYLSSDRWPALVAGLVAVVVWSVARRRRDAASETHPLG